jgi:hypothetical protein
MTLNSSETTQESQQPGRTAEADRYLARASSEHNAYSLRQILALAGVGHALLALGEKLDGGLADVADAVTGVQQQVGVLCDHAPGQDRRPWFGRRHRRDAGRLAAADMAVIRQALADAAEWRRCENGAGTDVADERLAFGYLTLRERLGGGAS